MWGTGVKPLCWSPRVYDTVRNMRLYQAGAGAGMCPHRTPSGCPLISTRPPDYRRGVSYQLRAPQRQARMSSITNINRTGDRGLPSTPACRRGRPSRPLALRGVPLPTLGGGGAAARPACLRQSGACGGWSPPPSRLRRQLLRSVGGGSGLRTCGACQPPAVAQGNPSAMQAQVKRPCGAGLHCSSPAPVAA